MPAAARTEPAERTAPPFFRWGLLVLAVALGVRIAHVWQTARAPFFEILLGDGQRYDAWAREIAGGDWLGQDVFYQAPLYPYVLGVIYRIGGADLVVARLVQALLGAMSCVLVAHASARLLSRRAGVVAGLILALYAPAIFLEGLIQKAGLSLLLVSTVIWFVAAIVTASSRATRYRHWVGLGLATGALMLTRENAVVFLAAIAAWLLLDRRWTGRERARAAGLVALALIVVLIPVTIRNQVVGGELHLTTSQLGPNLYIGNNPEADGTYRPLRPRRSEPRFERRDATELAERDVGRALSPREVSRYWTRRAIAYVADEPGDWLALVGRKIVLTWNATEIADTDDQYTWADASWTLRAAGWIGHLGVLAPLALGGIVLTWPRRRDLWPLLLLLGAYVTSVAVFYVFARYRLPIVPFLVVFAAGGVCAVPEALRETSRRRVVLAAAVVLGAGVFCNWRVVPRPPMRATMYCNLGIRLLDLDREDDAIPCLEQALAIEPRMDMAHYCLGVLHGKRGNLAEASARLRRAIELDGDFADAHNSLGNVLLLQGDVDAAARRYEEALRLDPAHVHAHNNLGAVFEARGELGRAVELYERALELDPSYEEARANLARARGG